MPLSDELKKILFCPKCKGALEHRETEVRCLACRLSYRVRQGIPVMLEREAQPLED